MEFGENGAVISNAPEAALTAKHPEGSLRKSGFNGRPNRYIRRNKLACFISSLLAVLFVALVALIFYWIFNVFLMISNDGVTGQLDDGIGNTAFGQGAGLAVFASLFNWVLFFIVVPITWFFISQTVGRLAHRGITRKWAYLRWMALCGAGLVALGAVSMASVSYSGVGEWDTNIEFTAMLSGALLTGALIGSVAGVFTGMIFLLIVRPATQLRSQNIHTADVF